jgi:aldose 1-epimerase
MTASAHQETFGTTAEGEQVGAYTLKNAGGIELRFIAYGGIIQSLRVPDRAGRFADVTLGYDTLAEYERDTTYFGALVGRYGNRIARGRFTLDGREHRLATNNGPNHLHGGVRGFNKVLWDVAPAGDASSAVLSYTSPDGEEGYPGTLVVRVTYTLTDSDELAIDYHATTDRPTPVNLTQHAYFNLAGHDAGAVLDHEITIAASRFTPVDGTLIPTGELRPVHGTPLDFTAARRIGDRIDADDEQLRAAGGYDQNFVLADHPRQAPAFAARLREPRGGRVLEVHTTEPGLQFYSGNMMPDALRGKGGRTYRRRGGLCLETQHFPDSPNHPHFPSTIVRPGVAYRSRTVYRFLTE